MIFFDFICKSYSQLSIAFLIADFLPKPSYPYSRIVLLVLVFNESLSRSVKSLILSESSIRTLFITSSEKY